MFFPFFPFLSNEENDDNDVSKEFGDVKGTSPVQDFTK